MAQEEAKPMREVVIPEVQAATHLEVIFFQAENYQGDELTSKVMLDGFENNDTLFKILKNSSMVEFEKKVISQEKDSSITISGCRDENIGINLNLNITKYIANLLTEKKNNDDDDHDSDSDEDDYMNNIKTHIVLEVTVYNMDKKDEKLLDKFELYIESTSLAQCGNFVNSKVASKMKIEKGCIIRIDTTPKTDAYLKKISYALTRAQTDGLILALRNINKCMSQNYLQMGLKIKQFIMPQDDYHHFN